MDWSGTPKCVLRIGISDSRIRQVKDRLAVGEGMGSGGSVIYESSAVTALANSSNSGIVGGYSSLLSSSRMAVLREPDTSKNRKTLAALCNRSLSCCIVNTLQGRLPLLFSIVRIVSGRPAKATFRISPSAFRSSPVRFSRFRKCVNSRTPTSGLSL